MNHKESVELGENLAMSYKNDLYELKNMTEGFARELERVQILFR